MSIELAYGEQNPSSGETAISWQTWSDGAAGIPDVNGDANWGQLKLNSSGEEGRSAVYDHGSAATRTYTLTENLYGSGSGDAVLQIRGSATAFAQDDLAPLWETYSAPISRTWRYVQIRESTLIETFILDTFGSRIISYLPLKETSGTTLADVSGNGRNGTVGGATGPTLGVEGIGDGKTAVSFPGSNAHINWYSTSLRDAFDGTQGGLIVWGKVANAGVWSDGVYRVLAVLAADSNNIIRITRSSSNNNAILIQMIAGSVSRAFYATFNARTTYFMAGLTWAVDNATIPYINGAKVIANMGAPGAWSGSLSSIQCILGASTTADGDGWSGSEAHAVLLNEPPTQAEMLGIWRALGNTKMFTFIGDSITWVGTNILNWTTIVRDSYNGGRCGANNYAASGETILSHMDGQVVSAANDNADIIIIHMGTNDTTGTGIQAEIEENLIELKASNPNAMIYYMNLLPRWTDTGGGTEVDKSYVRAPIAAACAAQGVTCWDTYNSPWITAADTTDGLHPNASGHAKIAAQVLARLP